MDGKITPSCLLPYFTYLLVKSINFSKGVLLLVYNDRQSTYEELLDKSKSFSIHHRNLPVVAMEMDLEQSLKK